jgi:hypothetical protein
LLFSQLFGSSNNYIQKDNKKQAKKDKPVVDKGLDLNLKLKIVDPLNYKVYESQNRKKGYVANCVWCVFSS